MIKNIIKKLLPKKIFLFYHKILAYLAAFFYGNPSNKLIVIGVTGTAGKSTTVYLIGKILEEAGYRVGWTNSISFKIAEREIENKFKMTMPGRFFLQKILKQMVETGCQYAVIETSSEGILQSRHLGINYDIAVFTNLSPEHIEAHGSFANYKKTKAKLFGKLKNEKRKIVNGQEIKKTIIVNLNDENADYFLSFLADEKIGYTLSDHDIRMRTSRRQIAPPTGKNDTNKIKIIKAEKVNDSRFTINNLQFQTHLSGEFNVYNALAAISVIQALGVSLEIAKKTLEKVTMIPGRMEEVINQPFKVFVDYAHTPVELSGVYQTIQKSKCQNPNAKLICVLGSCGGGRDKWKRPELGKLAAKYCDYIILTNEDPYDENPSQILTEIKSGISNSQFPISNVYEILDRREAIKKALSLAKSDDAVIITGKGCEPWMCVAGGKKIPWDDRKIVQEEFNKLSTSHN